MPETEAFSHCVALSTIAAEMICPSRTLSLVAAWASEWAFWVFGALGTFENVYCGS